MKEQQSQLVSTATEHKNQLIEIREELNSHRKELNELKSMTGADVKKSPKG